MISAVVLTDLAAASISLKALIKCFHGILPYDQKFASATTFFKMSIHCLLLQFTYGIFCSLCGGGLGKSDLAIRADWRGAPHDQSGADQRNRCNAKRATGGHISIELVHVTVVEATTGRR
jgi:hypothetical protein